MFPSDYVNRTFGGMGYVAGVIGLLAFVVWVGASMLGLHDPRRYRYPIRGVLAVLWIVSLASYAVMDSGALSREQLLGSERWIQQVAPMTGVACSRPKG